MSFIIGYACGLATLIFFWIAGFILSPWLRALTSGAHIHMATILGMRLRRTPPHLLIDTYLRLKHRNKNPDMTRIETVYLANRGTIHTAEDLIDRVLAEQIQ